MSHVLKIIVLHYCVLFLDVFRLCLSIWTMGDMPSVRWVTLPPFSLHLEDFSMRAADWGTNIQLEDQWEFQNPKMRYYTICLAIFWGYIPLHRSYIWNRYLQYIGSWPAWPLTRYPSRFWIYPTGLSLLVSAGDTKKVPRAWRKVCESMLWNIPTFSIWRLRPKIHPKNHRGDQGFSTGSSSRLHIPVCAGVPLLDFPLSLHYPGRTSSSPYSAGSFSCAGMWTPMPYKWLNYGLW